MSRNFKNSNPDQDFLLPVSTRDWVSENDLVRFVLRVVEKIDLEGVKLKYRTDGRGGAAFHPQMMMEILIYSYMLGLRSTRKIEEACRYDLRFRLICGQLVPDHTTISRFRKNNTAELESLFLESLRLCTQAGLVKPGFIAVDGTKISANASKKKNLTFEELATRSIRKYFRECDEIDAQEDELFGEEGYPTKLPDSLDTGKKQEEFITEALQRMREEQDRVEANQRERLKKREEEERKSGKRKTGSKPKSPEEARSDCAKKQRINTTDPDSRMMKGNKGYEQSYNVQMSTTPQQVVTAVEVSSDGNDYGLLHTMVEKTRGNLADIGQDDPIEIVVADAGYATLESLRVAEEDPAEFFIATRNERDLLRDLKRCPVTDGEMPEGLSLFERMGYRLKTQEGGKAMARRGQTIEAVFGQMKFLRRFDRFMMRGIAACKGEAFLFAATHNLMKLARYQAVAT